MQANLGFYPVVDGFFKEINLEIQTDTAIATMLAPVFGFQLLNQTERLRESGIQKNATLDWETLGNFAADEATAMTTGAEIMTHWSPMAIAAETALHWKERISRVVMANHRYSINYGMTDMADVTATGGAFEIFTEIMQVVNPVEFNFIYARPTGLKFFMVVAILEETNVSLSVEFPCEGYLTNISVLNSQPTLSDNPIYISWTTTDIDIKDNWAFTENTFFSRGRNKNGFSIMAGRNADVGASQYAFHFNHMGNKRVEITDMSMLNFYMVTDAAASLQIIVQADFVPKKGSTWRQVFVETTYAGSENYDTGWEFPIDLDNCVVTIVANIITGVGTMFVKILHPENLVDGSIGNDSESDIADTTDYAAQGMTSAQNLQAILPFSSTKGAQQPQLNLGRVFAGTHFSWDWIIGTTISDAELYFVITGRVGKRYYSRGAKFIHNPNVLVNPLRLAD